MEDNKPFGMNQSPAGLPQSPLSRPTPPPPPPPEITLRTMKSDLGSLRETGGSAPQPRPFTPPELKSEAPRPNLPPPPPPRITPSEFDKPKFEIKTPGPELSKGPMIEEEPSGNSMKKILMWIGIAVVAVAVGFGGYYYVFPLLFPAQEVPAPVINTPVETPSNDQGAGLEIPIAELPSAQPLVHESLLSSVDSVVSVSVATPDLSVMKSALSAEAAKELPSGSLIETTLNDSKGQLALSSILPMMLPEFSPEVVKSVFAEDFTVALYRDANGVWPIYVMKLSLEASIIEAQSIMNDLEKSAGLANFFLKSPGTASSAGFKSGKAGDALTRYITFSQGGAALNTAWVNDKFIISTSYNGLKKVLTNLK